MKFKQGQEVVCVADGWLKTKIVFFGLITTVSKEPYGPKKDELVTVAGYYNNEYVYLNEYPLIKYGVRQAYAETAFEPVVPMDEIEKLLEKNPTHV